MTVKGNTIINYVENLRQSKAEKIDNILSEIKKASKKLKKLKALKKDLKKALKREQVEIATIPAA